jgi:LiaF transmembrane domain
MNVEKRQKRIGASRMVLGLYLLLLGGLVLADNLGYEIPGELWSYWPFLLLGLGTVKLVWPGERDERRSGFWLVVVGAYGLLCVFHVFGLTWGNAWPIFLIAYGVLLVHDSWQGGVGRREDRRAD